MLLSAKMTVTAALYLKQEKTTTILSSIGINLFLPAALTEFTHLWVFPKRIVWLLKTVIQHIRILPLLILPL